jgi:uncharacterized DUF497 family protein
MDQSTVYDFQWDPAKAAINARKNGVTFEQAATVFLDVLALTVYDNENSDLEERWFTLGCGSYRPARQPDAKDALTKMSRNR